LKNVFEAADCLAKTDEKAQFILNKNEHFEPVFNAAAATQIVFQRSVKEALSNSPSKQSARRMERRKRDISKR
jgi:hypothetical protein